MSFEHRVPYVQKFSFKCLSTDCNQRIRDGIFSSICRLVTQSRFNICISSFAFDLVDLTGMEEIEISPDMLVNIKDFAVETRFVVAISVRRHVRHFPQGPQVDRLFVV